MRENTASKLTISSAMVLLCLLDSLFFPYIRSLSISLTILIVPIWYLLSFKKINFSRDFYVSLIVLTLCIFSLLYSTIKNQGNFIGMYGEIETLKINASLFVILLFVFLTYFFYLNNFSFFLKNIKSILLAFIAFNFVIGFAYFYSPEIYFKLRTFWTMSGKEIQVGEFSSMYRFTGIFSDPNNAGVAFAAVLAFLLFNLKLKGVTKIVIIFVTGFNVVMTMSSTALLCYLLVFGCAIVYDFKEIFRGRIGYLVVPLIMLIPLWIYLYYSLNIINSVVVDTAINRMSENNADSRISIWSSLLSIENFSKSLIFGRGGAIVINDLNVRPHSGHLYLIYGYGLLAYFGFMFVFFRVRKNMKLIKYIFAIPLFLGFTVNVGIIDFRFAMMFSILFAGYSGMSSKTYLSKKYF